MTEVFKTCVLSLIGVMREYNVSVRLNLYSDFRGVYGKLNGIKESLESQGMFFRIETVPMCDNFLFSRLVFEELCAEYVAVLKELGLEELPNGFAFSFNAVRSDVASAVLFDQSTFSSEGVSNVCFGVAFDPLGRVLVGAGEEEISC